MTVDSNDLLCCLIMILYVSLWLTDFYQRTCSKKPLWQWALCDVTMSTATRLQSKPLARYPFCPLRGDKSLGLTSSCKQRAKYVFVFLPDRLFLFSLLVLLEDKHNRHTNFMCEYFVTRANNCGHISVCFCLIHLSRC